MTQIECLARLRIVVDEPTAGKWNDTDLYKCIDGGHNRVIQMGLTKEKMSNWQYKSPVLRPLIALDTSNTTTIGASIQEFTLPSDYLNTYIALYSYSNGGTQYPCAIVDFSEAVKRGVNSYANSFKTPLVYARAEKLGFYPQPTGAGAGNYAHYYYKQPATVTSSQDFTLREETHEAILEYACYLAFEKNSDPRASAHLNNFLTAIEGIV